MALVTAALALAAAGWARADGPAEIVDDDFSAKATLGHFDYVGHWQHVAGKFDGRSMGTSTRSTSAGDVAALPFRGTRVRLFGVRGPSGGFAAIELDDKPAGKPVDFYAPAVEPHALIYESAPLPTGVHTLGIVVLGIRNARARYYYVNIDDAEIEATDTAERTDDRR